MCLTAKSSSCANGIWRLTEPAGHACPMGCNRLAIYVNKHCSGGRPGNLGARLERRGTQPLQECAILVKHRDVLSECRNIADSVYERIFHMPAIRACGLRYQQHAPASACLGSHKCASFFNTGQNQNIALSHQLGNVVPMTQDFHARGKHGRKLFLIVRQKFSGDEKSSILAGRRFEPCLKGIMYALAHCTDSYEEHS